jgi:crossover junction endodeoxyribonuclease RuvC
MILIGIDPGLAALGYGVIAVEGSQRIVRTFGVVRTARRAHIAVGRDLTIRIGELARAFERIVDEHRPDGAAIEEFRFYGKGVTSSLQVANVVGMLRESLRARGIATAEYSAQEIKRAVAGSTVASKREIQRMVQIHLRLATPPRPEHAADALATALTHAARLKLLQAAGGRR